jgi:small multidrug resistance pump
MVMMFAAIAVEIAATSMLRSTHGFTRVIPTIGCLAAYAVAFGLISRVIRDIPVGIVYAIWSGVGTAAIAAIGVLFLGDRLSVVNIAGISLVVAGVLVLNLG